MMEYWKQKLTPFDAELFMMVESLTGEPCEPRNGGDHFYIVVDYSIHPDPDFVSAVMDAIAGRTGERFMDFKDYPESQHFCAYVKFDTKQYPGFVYCDRAAKENPETGDLFKDKFPTDDYAKEIRAIQVLPGNAGRLLSFVGNGEMELPKDGSPCVFHFLNAQSVWAHAHEGEYVIRISDSRFCVLSEDMFNNNYSAV